MQDAADYMAVYMGGLLAVAAYYTPFSILRALGDSKTPLIFLAFCSVLNIILDLIFVVPLGMGVIGAAVSAVLLAVFWFGGHFIMGIFVSDAGITALAHNGIRITSLFFMALGVVQILRFLLNGAGDSIYALINGIVEIIARIGFAFALTSVPFIGIWGIWLTTGLTWLVTAAFAFWRYRSGAWMTKSLIQKRRNTMDKTITEKQVLVLMGSPRKGGNCDRLSDAFLKGAAEAGCRTEKIDLKDRDIKDCLGCCVCQRNGGACVQKDDMAGIIEKIKASDVIAFAAPVYFYTWNRLMKRAIDRTIAAEAGLTNKTFYLLSAGQAPSEPYMATMIDSFRKYIGCFRGDGNREGGYVFGYGTDRPGDVDATPAIEEAYRMGKAL